MKASARARAAAGGRTKRACSTTNTYAPHSILKLLLHASLIFLPGSTPFILFSHTSLLSLSPSPQQLGEEIGRGSSGKVYRALNRETGDFRAIKEIPTRNMPPGHLEAIQSEIDLLHTLQHDQIVRYFETIRTEGHLYLVLEYVENGSLATLIKNFGAFPEHLVCVYVRQLLRGLEWLHEQGVPL